MDYSCFATFEKEGESPREGTLLLGCNADAFLWVQINQAGV